MFPMHGGFMGRKKGGPITSGLITLEFDDILNAPVADPTDVADWNTVFALPTNGIPFTSVSVTGNIVELFGGASIALIGGVFGTAGTINSTNLVRIEDTDCIIAVNANGFRRQINLTNCILPTITFADNNFMQLCSSLINFEAPNLQSIIDSSFRDCVNLEELTLESVVSITGANSAFGNCVKFRTAVFPSLQTLTNISCFSALPALEEVVAPNLVTMGSRTFQNSPKIIQANYPLLESMLDRCYQLTAGNQDATMATVNMPSLTSCGVFSWIRREGLTSINLSSCTNLGGTTGNDGCFGGISGNTITFTLPVGTRTDGDAVALAAANTVTFLP